MLNSYKILILNNLKEMEECLFATKQNQDINMISKNLNKFIDLFLSINNTISVYSDNDNALGEVLREGTEKLSDDLVNIIEAYNQKKQTSFMLVQLKNVFEDWSSILKKHLKYKILVLGVNQMSLMVNNLIDPNKADVVSFIDDSGEHSGKYLANVEIIELNDISQKSFDYVFNVSANEHIVTNLNRLLGDERFIDYLFLKKLIVSSPEFYMKHSDFLANEKKFTGILTGLSYVQKGVNENLLLGNFVNLANPGQDLFYDFEIFKYAFGYSEIREHLQHVIIGLSYYSFHYDLSKSANEARVNYYYPVTKTMHNNQSAGNYLVYHHLLEELEANLLHKDHFLNVFELEKAYFQKIINDGYEEQYDCQKRTDQEILDDIKFIKRDYHKNYPETVNENKKILKEYLEFLRNNSLKPIITVCPVTKLYQSFTPLKFKQELYEIINELSLEFDFQFFDYYSSDEFDDSDFFDPSHMNNKGAIKLSSFLNRDIVW